jgi:hypothetical protein
MIVATPFEPTRAPPTTVMSQIATRNAKSAKGAAARNSVPGPGLSIARNLSRFENAL